MTSLRADQLPPAPASAELFALRTLREMVRTARALGQSNTDDEVLAQASANASRLLGYQCCAMALRQDDGNFRYAGEFTTIAGSKRPGADVVLAGSAYHALCCAATPLDGALWLPAWHPVLDLAEVQAGLIGAGPAGHEQGPAAHSPRLWAPIVAEDGTDIGFVMPLDAPSSPPGPFAALLLATLAEVTGLGLEVGRVGAAGRRTAAVAHAQRRQLEQMIAASLEFRGQAALDDALADIARAMASAVGWRRAAIYLLSPGDADAVVRAGTGFEPAQDGRLDRVDVLLVATVGIDAGEADRLKTNFTTLAGFAPMMRPEMRVSRSFLFDHRHFELPDDFRAKLSVAAEAPEWVEGAWHLEDSLTVPLEDRQGHLVGLISLDQPLNRAVPTTDDCRALELFADQCALAVAESRRLEAALEEATTDEMTGLANRRALLERAPELVLSARRTGSTCSCLYIDIDHFKDVNDSFGHATGDEVIAAVGRGIANRLRRGDLVARYGGEEFVAVLPDTALDEAVALAEEIRRLVATTSFVAVNPPLQLHVSVGVAALRPGDDTQALLAAADAALYQAKRAGRDRVCAAPA
jgi:diguanylate cyclase (GGDEF)-like protein